MPAPAMYQSHYRDLIATKDIGLLVDAAPDNIVHVKQALRLAEPVAATYRHFVKPNAAVLVPRLPRVNATVRIRQVFAQLLSVFQT